jgi:hypothetical protein
MENRMFAGPRYVTRGIQERLSFELQMVLWDLIEKLEGEKDYLQVFTLKSMDEVSISVIHSQECPNYSETYRLSPMKPMCDEKVFVIDNGEYSTMLFAEEY